MPAIAPVEELEEARPGALRAVALVGDAVFERRSARVVDERPAPAAEVAQPGRLGHAVPELEGDLGVAGGCGGHGGRPVHPGRIAVGHQHDRELVGAGAADLLVERQQARAAGVGGIVDRIAAVRLQARPVGPHADPARPRVGEVRRVRVVAVVLSRARRDHAARADVDQLAHAGLGLRGGRGGRQRGGRRRMGGAGPRGHKRERSGALSGSGDQLSPGEPPGGHRVSQADTVARGRGGGYVRSMISVLPGGSGPTAALEPDGRTKARAMGALLTLGGITVLLWLALPHPATPRERPSLAITLGAFVLAGALLAGICDRLAPRWFVAIAALVTMAISVGVYFGAGGGFGFLYLWVAPFAFAVFTPRQAFGIVALVAAGYASAMAASGVPADEAVPRWLLSVATVTVVGLLVGRLVDLRRASDERFVRGFADSSIGMGLLSAEWRWFEVNDALCRMLGRSREELIGRSPADITHPDDLVQSRAIVDRALTSESERAQTFTKRYLCPDGSTVWTRVDSIFVKRPGRESYFFAQIRDVTAERRAQEEHARQARQQAAAARLGRFALAEQDLDAVMQEVAGVVAETLGVEHTGVLALSPAGDELWLVAGVGWEPGTVRRAVIPAAPDDPVGRALRLGRPMVIEDAWAPEAPDVAALLRRRGVASGMTVQISGRDGPWGALTAHSQRARRYAPDETDFLGAVANVVSGAVDRHQTEEEVRHAALHDALTGLPNRTLGLDRLEGALARRRRDGRDVAVLLLDLDLFKLVNDSYGHGIGDDLLVTLAPRLHDAVRPSDTVARLGGDEFMVVCEQLDGARDAIQVAERVAQAVSQPIVLRSGEHFITASIGIAMADSADRDPETLIRDADAAMYRAKERGRGRFELFDDLVRARVLTRLRTETELRRALERDELRVVYQPVVDLVDGSVVAVEALVRWQHPERGLLDPMEFVPVAEDSGLIAPLGRWVLEAACREGAALQKRFPRPAPMLVCVNTSARQIADAAFPAEVAEIARRSGLVPGSLALEITETVLMDEAHAPVTVLTQMRDYGLRLMLDDFGTGYSSLAYLKRFPLDVVKVDRSFIAGLGHDEEDSAIVAAVISMAHTLGLTVVAEGVERSEQIEQLRRLSCDRVQGRLLARPLPAPELELLMSEGALRP